MSMESVTNYDEVKQAIQSKVMQWQNHVVDTSMKHLLCSAEDYAASFVRSCSKVTQIHVDASLQDWANHHFLNVKR